jgi:glycosyltransferase involved in cell wall biosynthesis
MYTLVSVCIPTRNGEQFLAEALESVELQTYENCEVVVSDDSSSDRTLEIVNEFASRSKYEYRIFNHEPSGIGGNWNHCVRQAKGEYIKFLFQDDLLEPECVSEMVRLMASDSELALIFCRRHLLISGSPSNSSISWCYMHADPARSWAGRLSRPVWGGELLKSRKLLCPPGNKVGEPPSVLIRREVFEVVGYFDEELRQSLDYEFWYRVFEKYKVGFIPRKLNVFRVHENQTTQQNQNDRIMENAAQALVSRIDNSLLHKDVLIRASGFNPLFFLAHTFVFHCRGWLIKLLVLLKILRGSEFLGKTR